MLVIDLQILLDRYQADLTIYLHFYLIFLISLNSLSRTVLCYQSKRSEKVVDSRSVLDLSIQVGFLPDDRFLGVCQLLPASPKHTDMPSDRKGMKENRRDPS